MTINTSYPGIYLSEEASLNFSVTSSATAVPAFSLRYISGMHHPEGDINAFYSWPEFLASLSGDDSGWTYYESVRLWFMCGGGKCYLVHKSDIEEAVRKYDDITMVVASGTENDIVDQFNKLISSGYRIFGLFDGPDKKIDGGTVPDDILNNYPATPYGAIYYPWCQSAEGKNIPPSAVAAAAIALTDSTRGPWKAPANMVINGITPNYPVTDDLQGRFNQGKALNMIRTFPDVGTVVWGARTLEDSDNWRYIPVRRLFSMVERDIQKALNKLVFEPNSQPTWQRVKTAVDNYLYRLWQQGGLLGNKADEAYFIRIGKGITMTTDDINQGKMIVQVGMAAARPAEFIILQFTQNIAQ